MAMIIDYIDKLAREKKRDVIFVRFEGKQFELQDYKNYKERNELIAFLEHHGVGYQMCGDFAREDGWESYQGQLYIDLPYDMKNQQYNLVADYLECEDGISKIEGVKFYYLPLAIAMQNTHHDEPGFWEKWAENF